MLPCSLAFVLLPERVGICGDSVVLCVGGMGRDTLFRVLAVWVVTRCFISWRYGS